MSKNQENVSRETSQELKTPHHRLVCSLRTAIFKPITKIEHIHSSLVKNFELVNGQPVSSTTYQSSDSVKNMSKYRVGDFSIITLDNIGLQSLRPQHYTPDIDAMLATIK